MSCNVLLLLHFNLGWSLAGLATTGSWKFSIMVSAELAMQHFSRTAGAEYDVLLWSLESAIFSFNLAFYGSVEGVGCCPVAVRLALGPPVFLLPHMAVA